MSETPVIGTDIFTTVLDITGIPMPTDRTIDGVSMLPAFEGRLLDRKIPLFWRTHVSPPGDRVALRIGDWKLVGNDTLTEFQLYEIQKDWKEEHDLAAAMPEKTDAMKKQLFEVWKQIEAEGPDHWWMNERQKTGARRYAELLNGTCRVELPESAIRSRRRRCQMIGNWRLAHSAIIIRMQSLLAGALSDESCRRLRNRLDVRYIRTAKSARVVI